MFDRDRFIDFRLQVVRLGLVACWLALGAGVVLAARDGRMAEELILRFAILAGSLLMLTLVPWRRLLRGRLGDPAIALWCMLIVVAEVVLTDESADEPLAAAFLGVIVFASALLVMPAALALIAIMAVTGYGVALGGVPSSMTALAIGARLGAFLGTTVFAIIAAKGISRELETASTQLDQLDEVSRRLEDEQRELDQLYAVSRTIGVGSNLAEVLPELVGRVASAVGGKLGIVFLYRADEEALQLMSPVWVAGQTVEADGYNLPLTDRGMVQRVFTSGEPLVRNDLGLSGPEDELLTDLETSNVVAVPLRIENRAIGVLMVADKGDGDFSRDDADRLEALAGPSALVLNQISRYEEATETGMKMAELAQLKTDFVSVVSHELRTPLTSIIGSLKTLQRPELAPAATTARDLVSTAERQANRLRSLIEDLLVVSRLDNQALPVRPTPTSVVDVANEVIRDLPNARGVVEITAAGRIPLMEVDPDHVRRILTNLVENALKYAPNSSIEVMVRSYGTEVWISVIDHGPGIPYELHEHIFEPFTQVNRHETRGSGGTGLGLSIVRGLSEAMGGRVWFEPTVGGGATFTVALPVASVVRPSV
ncbi:MAG TPA: ATP-binding protein [Acidimicrobiia bacterium]